MGCLGTNTFTLMEYYRKHLIGKRKMVVTSILTFSLILLFRENNDLKKTNERKKWETFPEHNYFNLKVYNDQHKETKRYGLGGGRLLTTERLTNIYIDDELYCYRHIFLVYKCDASRLCGGWGDMEKGVVSLFLLALLTNRTFIIRLTKPCKLQLYLQPNVYDWNRCNNFLSEVPEENISEFNYIDCSSKYLRIFQDVDLDLYWTKQVIIVRFNLFMINEIRRNKRAFDRVRWLLRTSNEETIHLILNTLFKPRQRIVKDAMKLHMNHIRGKHLVCAHVRKGKNPSIPFDSFPPHGIPNEAVIFNFLNRYDTDDKYVIYIATDSDYVRKQAAGKFHANISTNRTIVHIDRLGKYSHSKTEACEGFYTVLFQNHILSQCDTLVLTRSGFGGMAAYIRGSSDNLYLYHIKTNDVRKSNLKQIQQIFKFI